MGVGYFVGLAVIWLVPSFATESAVRMYYGCETGMMAWMMEGGEIRDRVFGEERRKGVVGKRKEEGEEKGKGKDIA